MYDKLELLQAHTASLSRNRGGFCALWNELHYHFEAEMHIKEFLRFSSLFALCLLAATLFSTPFARAQEQTLGSLNGTVTDTSGAAVPSAKITAFSEQTGFTRSTISRGNGTWQILNLPIGTYRIKVEASNFESVDYPSIRVEQAEATTINSTLKPGEVTQSVTVNANPLLNATDTTNGYTLDKTQISETPLATGSFTQLAVLAPGVNSELLSGMDTNAGLGNQNIWANGQRATSNTFQVNGVDVTNLFNGMSSSGLTSQRWNFNIGGSSTSSTSSAGQASIGGTAQTSTSVYGSNGNSLPSPPPEFLQEMTVNTSMYDAQQGATAGAQIDVSTATGTNSLHGQIYGNYASNDLNAAPYFFNQDYLLARNEGVGAFPQALQNPLLHNWWVGGTAGGPIIKDKLFFFAGFQHRYVSDDSTGLSQMTVPSGLTDDRSSTGLINAADSWGKTYNGSIDPVAAAILNAKLPDGSYMIPSAQNTNSYQYGQPNVTLIGTSILTSEQGNASIQYNLSNTDQLSAKYYYQTAPAQKTYGMSSTGGFPQTQENGSQVGAITNTNTLGSRMNFTETLGYARMYSYSYFTQTVGGGNFGINSQASNGLSIKPTMPGLLIKEMPYNSTAAPGLKAGPYDSFADIGYYQNRLNPSASVIFTLGKHTITAGGGYTYTQLNIENNRNGIPQINSKNFQSFLGGGVNASSVVESIDLTTHRNLADRYYRMNEGDGYAQDKWQVLPNLSITAGVRYDYHGGMTEKYGNMFNFDPSLYSVTGTTTSGFHVNNAGFIIAGNNQFAPTQGVSDSTLTGRQWGISPRLGFAWSPKMNHGTVVWRGGFGLYYDRGELFSYLSQPAGSGNGGPFGVTESAPLTSYIVGNGKTLENPLGSPVYDPPGSNPSVITQDLQDTLNAMTGSSTVYGEKFANCGGIGSQLDYTACPDTLNFGAYDRSNVLPYSMNFTFGMEWQPSNDVAITIGYVGNRGRHAVIPFPFNEPLIATSSNPVHGETSSYGFEVLNQNTSDANYDYLPIAVEPWNTEDGGNTDFRAPYVGFSPNAALFKTVGTSAYDALQTHLEKRLSHNLSAGVSYTFSHTYDEQSDLGLFFTGSNPDNLRSSYARSDFDRTHVITGNFDYALPNLATAHTGLAALTNDWHIGGWGTAESGQPYSLYEFYGAVGSVFFGDYPTLMNPVLPIKDASNPKRALTGNNGAVRAAGGSYIPAIDPSEIDIHYIAPGTDGVPVSTGSDPQDIYETNFAPGQRNLFRQAFQKQLNLSVRKQFHPTERLGVEYDFNVFNVTNTPSFDVPQNQTQIRQNDACSTSAYNNPDGNCAADYVNYGQIVTARDNADQQSAKTNLDELPYYQGTGRGITIPLQLPVTAGTSCSYSVLPNNKGCPNNGANFGSVTGTIGSSRMITMGLHVTF